jgi:hypothetical protein
MVGVGVPESSGEVSPSMVRVQFRIRIASIWK